MILFEKSGAQIKTLENVNDVSQLLESNQFLIRGKSSDAKHAVNVLGSSVSEYSPVYWKRKSSQQSVYTDYIVTVNK